MPQGLPVAAVWRLIAACMPLLLVSPSAAVDRPAIGAASDAGCRQNPKRVSRLVIDKPGVYENILVEGEWGESTLVKIRANDVTLRNCEIRRGRHNAVLVTGKNVVIDSCKIHHALASSFEKHEDAHGITGHPTNLLVRNCDIGMVSGDAVQFDPGRDPWDDVTIENCTLWTGPLETDAPGFKRGQRPGENGVDTKQSADNPRSTMTIRNCLFYGWNQPGQIDNMAALNLKNHVEVTVENCVFRDNEIALRLRGGKGKYGGARVTVTGCAIYDSKVAVRAEDKIEGLTIHGLGIGPGVTKKLVEAGGGAGKGFSLTNEFLPPTFAEVLKTGVPRRPPQQ